MKYYDREAEMAEMKKYEALSKDNAQMIVVTGRRRIGKTTLIKRSFTEIPFVYFFVGKKSESLLCKELTEILTETLGEDLGDFTSFKRLFSAIMNISKRRNFTLVFDEFQNLKFAYGGVFSDIQDVWDSTKDESRINLVICGSIYSKMKKIFDDKDEPLFGRATARFKIKPFRIDTIKEILKDNSASYTNEDLLALYMITGGVAKYVELLVNQNAVSKNKILEVTVSLGSYFIEEGTELLSDEFGRDYGNYFSVLSAISSGHTSRGDIESYVGFEVGGFLDRLETDYNVISKVRPYMSGENSRNVRYVISDNFLNFWFRFVYKYRSAVEIGNMEYVRNKIFNDYETYSGHVLEKYFRQKYSESGLYNTVTNYWEKGVKGQLGENNEIDIIAVNEADRHLVISECKRNRDRFDGKKLTQKAAKIINHHKSFTYEIIGVSIDDM